MSKPFLGLTAILAAVFLSSSPGVAAVADGPGGVTLTDECGLVRIRYPAGVTGPFAVERDRVIVVVVPDPDPAGASLTVFARSGQKISLAGSLRGTRTHVTPGSGCAEPNVDLVFGKIYCVPATPRLTLRNNGSTEVTGFRSVVGTKVTELGPIPPGEKELTFGLNDRDAYSVAWVNPSGTPAALFMFVHRTSGSCGPLIRYIDVTYTNLCGGRLEWAVLVAVPGPARVVLANGATSVATVVPPSSGPTTYQASAKEGDLFQAYQFELLGILAGGPHVYHLPSGCPALPVTGAKTPVLVLSGVLLVVAGVATYLLARRRRMIV